MPHFAIRPAKWEKQDALKVCRIDSGTTERDAVTAAFGRGCSPGQWLVKQMSLKTIRSDRQRVAALQDDAGWYDPCKGA